MDFAMLLLFCVVGLIIETAGAKDEVVKFIPALTISEEALIEGLDLLEKAIHSTLNK